MYIFLKQLENFFSYFYFNLQENDRFLFSESLLSNTNTVLLNLKLHIHNTDMRRLTTGIRFISTLCERVLTQS